MSYQELGLLSPGEPIPTANETDLIGHWALRCACAHMANGEQPGKPSLTASVSISPKQLRSSELVARVERAISEAGIAPGHLVLEITETTLIEASQ